jgi:hypothetical protein
MAAVDIASPMTRAAMDRDVAPTESAAKLAAIHKQRSQLVL